jgi:uncharacterized membrane protein YkvA (DUF1232 family)
MDWLVGLILGLLAAWLVLVAVLWLFRPRDARISELLRVVPDILKLVRDLATDHETPFGVRLALFGLLAWILSPIDLIPEFIPVIGPLDDVVVGVLVLRYVRRRVGEAELRRRWPGTPDGYAMLSGVLGAR